MYFENYLYLHQAILIQYLMKYFVDVQDEDALISNGVYNVVICKKFLFLNIRVRHIGSFNESNLSEKNDLINKANRYCSIYNL